MAISSPLQSKVPTGSSKTIRKLQTILLNRTKVKREIFQKQTILQNRRIENERRKQREDELEAPNLVTKPRGAAGLIAGSAKGFFERLVGFLSYLTAGWIINNLPTWISMGKEFIARTQQMGKILGGFITNSTDIFKNFTKLLGASLQNLMSFDFSDTSGRVKTAFDDLNLSVENWGTDFENAIKLITTPLSEGIASGEDARPLGTENTNEGAYETTAPYSGSGGGGGQGGKYKPLLDLISSGESPGGGYSAMFPSESHPQILNMSIAEVIQFQNQKLKDGRRSAAIGRYQMLYPEKYAAAAGLSLTAKFSPENQDKMVIAYLKKNRRLSEWEQGKISDESFSEELAREFGAFKSASGFVLPRNTGSIGFDKLKPILQKIKSQPSQTPQQSSPPQQSTPGTGQSFRPLPQGSFKGGEDQRYLAPREGTRKHLGIDITESNWKRGTDPRIPVVAIRGGVVSSKDYVGGTKYDSGMVIDQDDGYSVRYLHMTPSVRPGQKVSAGQRIGRLVDLGDQTHLHIELYAGSKRLDPTSYITTIEKGGVPAAIARQQSPTPSPAQITSTGTPQNPQIPQSLAPERTGQTVFVSQNPSSPARQIMSSGGGGSSGGGSSQISDFALLNNFIKNKLLLDLAYL
jgi:murein DD-endopeptidase MepM/ murein hydrolase activator NlpD